MWRLSPGSASHLLLSPHPTVRNNLQHCRALCHLTLHGHNSQLAEGLNKRAEGLYAWKNSHPAIIAFEPILIHLLANSLVHLAVAGLCAAALLAHVSGARRRHLRLPLV